MNEAQRTAYTMAMDGHSFCVTGPAGTGKSYTIRQIVKGLRDRKKRVAVTSSTGLAGAQMRDKTCRTLHSWAGILDGRYGPKEQMQRIVGDFSCQSTKETIVNTEVLIISEISMISKYIFEVVEASCRAAKQTSLLFGGIQLIVEGDFMQLKPVAKTGYGDLGLSPFESEVWKETLVHTIHLTEVVRQSDLKFVVAISEVSVGAVSEETQELLQTLARPLPDEGKVMNLYARRSQVNVHNNEALVKDPGCTGNIVSFKALDSGDVNRKEQFIAPCEVSLRVGCPVLLLKNMCSTLVNGSMGVVVALKKNPPSVTVKFGKSSRQIKPMKFEDYSQQRRKIVASRTQIPLLCAYALTIHKCQGMTLDAAVVDCLYISQAGMLGVAIGRVKQLDGLHVTNYSPRVCRPHPPSVMDFNESPGAPFLCPLVCCKRRSYEEPEVTESELLDTLVSLQDEMDVPNENRHVYEPSKEESAKLHDILNLEVTDLEGVLCDLSKEEEATCLNEVAIHPILQEVVDNTCTVRMSEFLSEVWTRMVALVQACLQHKPCQQQHLSLMTKVYDQYLSSPSLDMARKTLFPDSVGAKEEHLVSRLVYNLHVKSIDEYQKLKILIKPSGFRKDISETGHGKLRYLSGRAIFVVSKDLGENLNRHSPKIKFNKEARQDQEKCNLLEQLREEFQVLADQSQYTNSLTYTQEHEYSDGKLVHISDNTFKFFLHLEQERVQLHTRETLICHRELTPQYVEKTLQSMKSVRLMWSELFKMNIEDSVSTLQGRDLISSLASIVELCITRATYIADLREKVVSAYLRVGHNQFRKSVMAWYGRQQKGALRDELRGKMSK